MAQNIYDNPAFFEGYAQLPRSVQGLDGAPEWPALKAMLPDLTGKAVIDLGCGYGWFCRAARELGAPLFGKVLRLCWARHHLDDRAEPDAALQDALAEAERLAGIAFPLSGRDALALGAREGPGLGDLLDAVEAWWAERDFAPSREDCLERLRELE